MLFNRKIKMLLGQEIETNEFKMKLGFETKAKVQGSLQHKIVI